MINNLLYPIFAQLITRVREMLTLLSLSNIITFVVSQTRRTLTARSSFRGFGNLRIKTDEVRGPASRILSTMQFSKLRMLHPIERCDWGSLLNLIPSHNALNASTGTVSTRDDESMFDFTHPRHEPSSSYSYRIYPAQLSVRENICSSTS